MQRVFNGVQSVLLAIAMLSSIAAAPLRADTETATVLVLGDSLSAGYGLEAADAFPAQLQRALGAAGLPATVINAGVSGDTTAGGRARLGWLMAEGAPDLLIVELGGNDGLRAIDPASTRANLAAIIQQGQAAGARVLLTGMMAPPNFGREYVEAFNAVYPELAETYGVAFYPFFLDGVAGDPALNQPDGIHPTPDGIVVIVERILSLVKSVLAAE